MTKLANKVALITGGNKGIGKGIARAFVAEGASVVLVARGQADLDRTAGELASSGVKVLAMAADLTDEKQVQNVFARTVEQFKRLDILVNNAGAFDGGPIDKLSVEAWDKVISVNLRAPFLCMREAIRIMKKQSGGRIINIGSIAAQRVRPGSAAYSASKHGLWGLTQVGALEGRDFNITCGCIHPGNTEVERRQGSGKKEDDEPMMSVDDIGQTALLMASLPEHVNMLEAIVMPVKQMYVGRG